MESTLFLATLYLGLAVIVVPVAVRMGLGSVLGYLAAGIVLGPVLGLAGAETTELQHVAEFGVVMMLFLIGLELDPRSLWLMRASLVGLGLSQVVLSATALSAALILLGFDWHGAVGIGLILAMSSTAIVLQTLTEKRLMRTPGGKASFAVLLTQDMAVVPILAALPLLARSLPREAAATSHDTADTAAEPLMTLVQSLPPWGAALLTLGIVAAIILGGHFLSRPVFRFVHASRLPEMSTFVSLLLVAGIAFLMMLVGLSPALGTFLAGVVLANSEFRHQIEADIRPFKGLLLGIFFITVGIGIDLSGLVDRPVQILGLTLMLLAIKAAVLFGIALFARMKGGDRWLFTFGLAQGGEFGFVLAATALSEQVLTPSEAHTVTLVISLSMLVTPLLFLVADMLARRRAPEPDRDPDKVEERGRVLIAGIGRFGQVVNRLVRSAGLSTVVLDADMATIETMRRFGVKGYFGDPSRPELLEAAGLDQADVLVVAVDDRDNATRIVSFARRRRPDLHIVARARDRVHVYELYQAGANDIVRETFDSSVRAGRYVLENTGFSDYEAAMISQTYYKVDRAAMKDLAELWVPGQPVHLNEAYVARARKLDRDLETALIEALEDGRRPSEAAE
ncbi:cation:proton antiporter domain-containing protein [Neotabrizicola shimadae]|uniref:Cation:proton antiporter n=1 Tax=Neotabrizicola shimadae TaxID=2807096 RepID=A0A8G1EF53_9RHOB|nr:cation:proton antiporter [Neotabrizicola shimadae]QYZ71534.1 cation:proton antiporter [Neotabrizicola shimadae]